MKAGKRKRHNLHLLQAGEDFSVRFYQFIKQKNRNLISLANAELLSFLWQTGKKLCQGLPIDARTKSPVLGKISSALSIHYGDFFSIKNLPAIVRFYILFPDFTRIAPHKYFLSWEHVLVLLEIEGNQERDFYLNLKVEQGLSVDELKNKIVAGLYEQQPLVEKNNALKTYSAGSTGKKKGAPENAIRSGFELIAQKYDAITNPFRQPLLASFQLLTEYSRQYPEPPASEIIKDPDPDLTLIKEILKDIQEYRDRQNRMINSTLNITFWEMGRQIREQARLKANEGISQRRFVDELSAELDKRFGIELAAGQLQKMMLFAEKNKDLSNASLAAYLLPWKNIIVLLKIESIEAISYYVNKLAAQSISWSALQKLIKEKDYELHNEMSKKNQIDTTQQPSSQHTVKEITYKTKGNSTMHITSIDFRIEDQGKRSIKPNVFKDIFTLDFLALF